MTFPEAITGNAVAFFLLRQGRTAVLQVLFALLLVLSGCGKGHVATHDEAITLYWNNNLEEARPLFEELEKREPGNSENLAWLAEVYRRTGKKEDAVTTARRALELNPRSSFAHLIIAEASNPVDGGWKGADSDTTWTHVMKAIACDSTDGNPWLLVWGEAIHRGEPSIMQKALRKMTETGFLTKAALSYGRWMLQGLPHGSILLTNGDMDTYPPCSLQEVEGFRRDVVVVNRGTLNTPWYARFIRDQYGVPLPFDDAQLDHLAANGDGDGNLPTLSDRIFRGWMKQAAQGSLQRPIAVAVTVEENYWSDYRANMRFAGAFLEWQAALATQTPDTSSMRVSLEGLTPESFAGPWVSEQDRSPVRRLTTKNLVRNVTETALTLAESTLNSRRVAEARRWANWADEVDRKAEAGPAFAERIAHLKERLATGSR
jgi:hypothetical protein